MSTTSNLTLGWRVDDEDHPGYWLGPNAAVGEQSDDDLVQVPAGQVARHTGIIAQSGSGKSFFLGRLVEEILLNTRAKVAILDPNADFRRLDAIQSTVWERAGYSRDSHMGMLPTERSAAEVAAAWGKIRLSVFRGDVSSEQDHVQPLQLWWPLLSMDLLAGDVTPAEAVEMRHCHVFVQAMATLLHDQLRPERASPGASVLLERGQQALQCLLTARQSGVADRAEFMQRLAAALELGSIDDAMNIVLTRAVTASQYVSPEAARYYFGRAFECEVAGALRQTPPPSTWRDLRAMVFDLPSLPSSELRLMAAYQVLTTLWGWQRNAWQEAMASATGEDHRVPCFIVVDEAHNLIPAEPRSPAAGAVREMFRTIAAEGRKFGLFLIVVSQRPDKLDPMILSECENKIVMHIDAPEVLGCIGSALGASAAVAKRLEECLAYRVGRGLMFGSWAPKGPVKFLSAARRTIEGGRNLDPVWWAQRPS